MLDFTKYMRISLNGTIIVLVACCELFETHVRMIQDEGLYRPKRIRATVVDFSGFTGAIYHSTESVFSRDKLQL